MSGDECVSLLDLDLASYSPSVLHDASRTFRETNCYVDLWIELLHALGCNPVSGMAFAMAVDFEGDQWTFFKPPPEDLELLYGIDVHEMQLYRPITTHAIEQLTAGRTLTVEADSFYLPDTAATSYRQAHIKSSLAIEAIDVTRERLRYFHNAGYHELSGEDFRGLFRIGQRSSDESLPPYVEIVRFDAGPRLRGECLRQAAHQTLRRHLCRRPSANPWLKFGERLAKDLPSLLLSNASVYHAYAFATVRQCGSAFELARDFATWLFDPDHPDAQIAQAALNRQVQGAKALLFRLARRRAFDATADIQTLAGDWQTAMNALDCAVDRSALSTA